MGKIVFEMSKHFLIFSRVKRLTSRKSFKTFYELQLYELDQETAEIFFFVAKTQKINETENSDILKINMHLFLFIFELVFETRLFQTHVYVEMSTIHTTSLLEDTSQAKHYERNKQK